MSDTKGKKGDGEGSEVLVQRVIREVGSGSSYPVLTKTNYSDWALLMTVKLKARHLWNVIEKGGADEAEEMMALDALCGAIPPEMVPVIAKKETAKAAWDAIATMRIGDDRVKKATAEQLRRKLDHATFNDGETVEDYALRLSSMAAHLTTLGDEVKDAEIVSKILRTLPPRFKQIAIAIKTLLDPSKMTVAELTGRLQEAEEELQEPPTTLQHEGKLYLTEEEWDAKRKKREAEFHTGGAGRRGGGGRFGGGRQGRGRGRAGSSSGGNKPTGDECRRCGKMGHWARECRSKPRREQAHVAQDEEEASLLLVVSSSPNPPPQPQSPDTATLGPSAATPTPQAVKAREEHGGPGAVASSARSASPIEIREHKVFAHLGEEKERENGTWVLYTGTTNHMSGSRSAFSKLEAGSLGTVRFGNDLVARIEGQGTVTFVCKNGELRSFSGVYFIPRLTTNIISLGQLDEGGYKVNINEGVLTVREPGGRLLAKVSREANRLYLLRIKVAELRCLAVRGRGDEVAWRWHERFGHVKMAALRKLAREELVRGLPEIG